MAGSDAVSQCPAAGESAGSKREQGPKEAGPSEGRNEKGPVMRTAPYRTNEHCFGMKSSRPGSEEK